MIEQILQALIFSMASNINFGLMAVELCGAGKCPPSELNKSEIGLLGPSHSSQCNIVEDRSAH